MATSTIQTETVETLTGTYQVQTQYVDSLQVIRIGKLIIISGFFNPVNDIAADVNIATIPYNAMLTSFCSIRSSTGTVVRLKVDGNKIVIESAFPKNQFYSFTLVSYI